MALNPTGTGDAIAAYLVSVRPTVLEGPISDVLLRTIWENIMTIMDADLANAEVKPGSFNNSGGSVTGTGGGVF